MRIVNSRAHVALFAGLTLATFGLSVFFYAELHYYGVLMPTGDDTVIVRPLVGGGYIPETWEAIALIFQLFAVFITGVFSVVQHRLRRPSGAWLDLFIIAIMSLIISVTLFS
jgi:hypothetical protein